MSTTEGTVTTSTADAPVTPAPATSSTTVTEPKTYKEHYADALKAQSIKDQEPEKTPDDDTSEPAQPVEEPSTEDQPPEAVPPEDTLLTAEEVSKLSGKELDLYKKAQKNYTLKTQQLASQRKELEQDREIISALKDPERFVDTVTQLAQHAGILPKEQTPQSAPVNIAPEWEFARPILQQMKDEAKAEALAEIRAEIAPMKSQTNEMVLKSMVEATQATLKTFGATHEGWEKYESKMLEIAKEFQAAEGVSELKYLDNLYKLATHGVQSAEKTKQVVDKMRKSAENAEVPVQGVQSERVEYAKPANISQMSSRERYVAAAEAAKRGQKWV